MSKREKWPPGLPADVTLAPTFSSQIIRRGTGRPEETYLDVTFLESKAGFLEVQAILFQNYYTSSFSVYMHLTTKSATKYVPLLTNRKIMPSAFCENGSQDWITLNIEELGHNYLPGKPLRFVLIQPHAGWDTYEIRNIHAVAKGSSSSNLKGSLPAVPDEKDTMVWKNCSLTTLLKEEARFFFNKSKAVEESAQRETDRIDSLVTRAQRESDKVAKTKAKKKGTSKKSSLAATTGISMDPTKKEHVIDEKDEPEQHV
jgi:hypothetical protein